MGLEVTNTLGKQREPLQGRRLNKLDIFVCGPTVYDDSHLGHARTYVAFDTIVRFLRFRGFGVYYLMNITDIDDKIIRRAEERGMDSTELAELYFDHFKEDMSRLRVLENIDQFAKATEFVDQIIEQIQQLIEKGFAYEAGGDVYYAVTKFDEFGQLSGRKFDELKEGTRDVIQGHKRDPHDFALWKSHKPGEPKWDSPWGQGRPGWHVEDTAITVNLFGPTYDVHGGAVDLIFPHHESEIAIAQSATGERPLVRYWLHTGFLNVRGEKMAKSLGNFITIRQALESYSANVLRFFFLNTHYRSPIDYTADSLDEASVAYQRLAIAFGKLDQNVNSDGVVIDTDSYRERFTSRMDDDFNTREAIAVLYDLVRELNRAVDGVGIHTDSRVGLGALLENVEHVLGVQFRGQQSSELTSELVNYLIQLREDFRSSKDWERADGIRDHLDDLGVIVEDSPNGAVWRLR